MSGIREFLRNCNEFVRQKEEDDLRVMEIDAEEAKTGASKCGCHNCISLAQSLILRYYAECGRLTDPKPVNDKPVHIGPADLDKGDEPKWGE